MTPDETCHSAVYCLRACVCVRAREGVCEGVRLEGEREEFLSDSVIRSFQRTRIRVLNKNTHKTHINKHSPITRSAGSERDVLLF